MTKEDLKIMQGWSLQRKIQVTQTRIYEWLERYNGQVYISRSGGKDSEVLTDLARRVHSKTPAVFIDTGMEYPEVRAQAKSVDNLEILRPEKTLAIDNPVILIYCKMSCSVRNDIGRDLGRFDSKALHPVLSHPSRLCWLSSVIVAIIGFLPVWVSYLCAGNFFITSQQYEDISKGASTRYLYFLNRCLYWFSVPS